MKNLYEMNHALQRSDLIRNRADVINDILGYGYDCYKPAHVDYPRGRGYGVLTLCDVPLLHWRRYDLREIETAFVGVDAVERALYVLSCSGHLFWF